MTVSRQLRRVLPGQRLLRRAGAQLRRFLPGPHPQTPAGGVTAVLITREPRWPIDARPLFPFDEVITHTACPSVFMRYAHAADARFPHIYVQDDDCLIDVGLLWREYGGHRITNAIMPFHQKLYRGTGVTLIGWGAFFPRAMARDFLAVQTRWRALVGDEIFEAEADRFFTWCFRPHQSVIMPVREFRRSVKMSARPGHRQTRDRILRLLRTQDAAPDGEATPGRR